MTALAEHLTTQLFTDYTSDSPSCRVYEPVDVDTTPARWSRIARYALALTFVFAGVWIEIALFTGGWWAL